jgi:hypothetical protein
VGGGSVGVGGRKGGGGHLPRAQKPGGSLEDR